MTKEEFNKVWKDTSREGILNQFYYDYMYMQKLKEDINKAIEYIDEMCLCSSGYFDYGDDLSPKHIVDILRGGEDNR